MNIMMQADIVRARVEYLEAQVVELKALVETAYAEGEGVIMSDSWETSDSAKQLKALENKV